MKEAHLKQAVPAAPHMTSHSRVPSLSRRATILAGLLAFARAKGPEASESLLANVAAHGHEALLNELPLDRRSPDQFLSLAQKETRRHKPKDGDPSSGKPRSSKAKPPQG